MSPSLDVVIVNWNAGGQLAECLASIGAALARDYELQRIVVVDNASSDGSAEALHFPTLPLTVLRNADNRGFAAGCNQGAAGSRADYLLFLNPDTRVYADTFDASIAFMESVKDRGVGISTVQLLDDQGNVARCCSRFPTTATFVAKMLALNQVLPRRFPDHFYSDWDHRDTREVDQVMGAYLLIRRAVFESLGGFDERFFVYFEDVDLSLRVRQAGWTSWHFAGAQAYHRGRGTTQQVRARRLMYSLRSRLLYACKHFDRVSAASLAGATLLLEPVSRVLNAVLRGNWSEIPQTMQGYLLLCGELPAVFRHTWNAGASSLPAPRVGSRTDPETKCVS